MIKSKLFLTMLFFRSHGGTSFSAPLITRKFAFLLNEGFSILEIPSILNAFARYYSNKKAIDINKKNGNGVIPVDSREMLNLINDKALVVITTQLSKDMRQGFADIKIPRYCNKYDSNIILSSNVYGKLAGFSTYEYVLDSSRVTLGRLNPFTKKIDNDLDKQTNSKYYNETWLRVYKGKFKTRNVVTSTTRNGRTVFKRQGGEGKEIEQWGIKFERNLIGMTRNKVGTQDISVALIFESANKNFFNEFINMNQVYIDSKIETIIDNEIKFF